MTTSATINQQRKPGSAILSAWLLAGTLDILAAITVYVLIMDRLNTMRLLQGIASSIFGPSAFEGGLGMALCGLVIHFLIALTFTIFYFIISRYIPFLQSQKIISGLLYGLFVWMVMNLVMLPILGIAKLPHDWKAITRGAVILMFCIGLPISLIIGRYYSRK